MPSERLAPRFTAEYRLDGGSWTATVASPPLSARGRTLESARIAVVATLAEHFGVAPSIVVLTDKVVLGSDVDGRFEATLTARDAALEANERSRAASEAAAIAARDAGVSLHDTAHLLGLSHSRIQQILDGAASSGRKKEQR